MAPIQRAGMEYEFDIVCDMDVAHNLVVTKTRMAAIDQAVVNKPNGAWFQPIRAWLSDGATPTPQPQPAPTAQPSLTIPAGQTSADWASTGSTYDGWTQQSSQREAFASFRKANNLTDEQAKAYAARALGAAAPIQYFRDFPGDRERLQAAIIWAMDQEVVQAAQAEVSHA
jgi:hypothetical protein